jgi:hypothetical protein
MLNNTLSAGAVGAGAASRYGSDQMMRLRLRHTDNELRPTCECGPYD